jgi:hypothetical protein
MLVASRGGGITTQRELRRYLFENLRIDADGLLKMNPLRLTEIAMRYRSRRVKLLADFVSRIQRHGLKDDKGSGE